MKRIADYVAKIDEELDGAKCYAEEFLYRKASGDGSWANRYKEMAQDELKHAGWIHDLAVAEIQKLSVVYTAPAEMQEAWDKYHVRYVERAAWVKQMLAM